jgi:hypothetical protein
MILFATPVARMQSRPEELDTETRYQHGYIKFVLEGCLARLNNII